MKNPLSRSRRSSKARASRRARGRRQSAARVGPPTARSTYLSWMMVGIVALALAGLRIQRKRHLVTALQGHKQAVQLVIPVITPSEDVQHEVDFGRRFCFQESIAHGLPRSSIRIEVRLGARPQA